MIIHGRWGCLFGALSTFHVIRSVVWDVNLGYLWIFLNILSFLYWWKYFRVVDTLLLCWHTIILSCVSNYKGASILLGWGALGVAALSTRLSVEAIRLAQSLLLVAKGMLLILAKGWRLVSPTSYRVHTPSLKCLELLLLQNLLLLLFLIRLWSVLLTISMNYGVLLGLWWADNLVVGMLNWVFGGIVLAAFLRSSQIVPRNLVNLSIEGWLAMVLHLNWRCGRLILGGGLVVFGARCGHQRVLWGLQIVKF